MNTPCLRCEKPLEEQQVDTVQARFCPACKGILMKHEDLTRMLEQSWRFVLEKDAREQVFHPTDALKTEVTFRCPDCGQPMEKYGYMGYAAIPIDRCDRCSLVWLDTDELQNMVLALAKLNYRAQADRKAEKERLDVASLGMTSPIATGGDLWLFNRRGSDDLGGTGTALAELLIRLLLRR